jgi:hypothetical protein
MDERKRKQVKSRQIAVTIDGIHTDVVLSEFVDVVHVLVTQRQKVGHLFECSSDGGVSGEDGSETFSVDCLLGSRETVEEVYARQIVAALPTEKKLLIALALQQKEPPLSMLHGLLAVLKANAFWALPKDQFQ